MPMFVHLTPESRAALIRRNGIGRLRRPHGAHPGGIFAVPVTRYFYVSHQWLRELRRRGRRPIVGVYFRIPDSEAVWVGHYNQAPGDDRCRRRGDVLSLGESGGLGVHHPAGRIAAKEIHRIRSLPQVVGWRDFPAAKGKPPFCTCKYCTRGEYGAARLRARLGSPDG